MRIRLFLLLAALALIGGACGAAAAPDPPAASIATPLAAQPRATDPANGEAPAATPAAAPTTAPTTTPPAEPGSVTPDFDGVAVPDFALTLQNRPGEFVLSEAATPVYLTFWAEW